MTGVTADADHSERGTMTINRRNVFRFAPAAALAVISTSASASAAGTAAGTCNSGCGGGPLGSLEDIEDAFAQLGMLSDATVRRMSLAVHSGAPSAVTVGWGIPLPGPAAIVNCALSAAWIFRRGADEDRIIYQVAEVVVSCVGIPATGWVVRRVAVLVWKYRRKIAAALMAIGLSAAQVGPLVNAPRP